MKSDAPRFPGGLGKASFNVLTEVWDPAESGLIKRPFSLLAAGLCWRKIKVKLALALVLLVAGCATQEKQATEPSLVQAERRFARARGRIAERRNSRFGNAYF